MCYCHSLFREKSGDHNEGVSWNSEEENRRLDINQVSAAEFRAAAAAAQSCSRGLHT